MKRDKINVQILNDDQTNLAYTFFIKEIEKCKSENVLLKKYIAKIITGTYNMFYSQYKLARSIFSNDADYYNLLELHEEINVMSDAWLIKAKIFYKHMLGDDIAFYKMTSSGVDQKTMEKTIERILKILDNNHYRYLNIYQN